MSDDSEFEPRIRRRRRPRLLEDESSSSDDSSTESVINPVVKRRRCVFEDSSSSNWDTDVSDPPSVAKEDPGNASDSSDGQSEKCPICLISFTTQEIGTPDSCSHIFCVDCIQEWSRNMNTCPVDRQEYRVIMVRKTIDGGVVRQIPIQPPNPQNELEIVEDLTFCEVCGLSDREDRMLLCDGCDLGYHLECLNPPLGNVPAGAWFCNDCSPDDVVDPEIMINELQMLLEDADDLERPTTRRRATSRLVPRTSHSERVRRRIADSRAAADPEAAVSSTTRSRRRPRRAQYRTVYRIDESTGETIAIKKKMKRKGRKKKKRAAARPGKTPKGRLARQLGMCTPGNVPQSLPDVRIAAREASLETQRWEAGIPTLSLFGPREDLNFFTESEDEGETMVFRRRPNHLDVAAMRRNRIKAVNIPSVSSSSDVLGSILGAQTLFHAKDAKLSVGTDGKVVVERERRLALNGYDGTIRKRPGYDDDSRNDSVPSSSGGGEGSSSSFTASSTVETSSTNNAPETGGEQFESAQECPQTSLCPLEEGKAEKRKKEEEPSEENPTRSGTPASESEIDIYSDIETVSTSEMKAPSPSPVPPATNTTGTGTDDDNDSEPDMVIDTDKAQPEAEDDAAKEEAAVTSTVDSNPEFSRHEQPVTSSCEIQSQAVQSSSERHRDEDEDSEDGCPNFSIYSKESITMAKNTDITLNEETNNQVGEVSSSPAVHEEEEDKTDATAKELNLSGGLYSDSEDESVVKRGVENSFGISDIRNMTEDISEEERSYTPCLDERGSAFRQGIEGLDTEMISDEDRNDFDESHELKTASDGDALEINAKESELDFTRPEDYEEGEIVDKLKSKKAEEEAKKSSSEAKKKDKKEDAEKPAASKEKESTNKDSTFKKLSKNNKERNYRDKDRDRSKSRDKKDKDSKKERRREKRKDLERYDVRALIAEKPRRLKDKFGRDVRRTSSRSRTRTPTPKRSPSKTQRSPSRRRSLSRGRKKKRRSRRRSLSRSRSRRSRSKTKRRRRTTSRERRKKSRERSKGKTRKRRSRTRSRSQSPKKQKEWTRRHSRDWTPSLSRSPSPEQRRMTPSWTPPRVMESAVRPQNLTVILTNDANKKKKERKKKNNDKRSKENERSRKRRRSDRTPPPSKEVFASGDNILVSVSFNKDNETRDVSSKRRREEEAAKNKNKKEKPKKKKRVRDLTGVKPVAIIDLDRSPFKELTPSPKDVIVLTDSDNEASRDMEKNVSSHQQVASPERVNTYLTGPKTPPEPQVKFTLATKQTQMRAISNPLHDPDDIEPEERDEQEEEEVDVHKGPNTPPEPPNSPPSSPDVYDPFEPTKSRSPTPEPIQTTQSIDDAREKVEGENRIEADKTTPPDASKSMTPPLADVQPADSQSSIQATPESSLGKSPEHNLQAQAAVTPKPIAQTIPFSSVPSTIITSTPVSQASARINILNTTIINASSSIPQRIVLPTAVKISPTKSTPIKPMPSKTTPTSRKSGSRNQNGDSAEHLGLDSPYSPGSSDYEDLFEPPSEGTQKPVSKSATKTTKSPAKVQSAFDALFGSPFNKIKSKPDAKTNSGKTTKKSQSRTKQVGVKIDEDNLKILDELPNSAVEMQVKDKFLKKLNRQERVVEEVKLVLKPHYNKKHINKEEYKDILRRAVPKICHNKSGEINPTKIKNLIEAYVKKVRHSKKVTSSSSSVNPQKA